MTMLECSSALCALYLEEEFAERAAEILDIHDIIKFKSVEKNAIEQITRLIVSSTATKAATSKISKLPMLQAKERVNLLQGRSSNGPKDVNTIRYGYLSNYIRSK
jgi:hypothetical protein